MIRTTLVAALVALLLTAGTAIGSANWRHTQNGIHCRTSQTAVLCLRADGQGYGMAFDRDFVFVTNDAGKRIFTRLQP